MNRIRVSEVRVGRPFTRQIALALIGCFALGAAQAQDKPNFLIIWGDDIGWMNTSAYNRGMMGYKTPNIDRIANEGALFTVWYGQQSCTAGRAAFVTGQSPFRTGLLKVGLPGAPEGDYRVITFDSDVSAAAGKVETVVLAKTEGRWGVVGYFIR